MGLLFTLGSCRHDHDYWHDDYHYGEHYYYDDYGHEHRYYYDSNTYNYIRTGRWYPAIHDGLTRCEYDSYVHFNDWEMLYYDCENYLYDRGRYEYYDGRIRVHYDNGDVVEFYINKACDNELIIVTRGGHEYHYVRY